MIAPGTDWPVGVAARIAATPGLPHPISPQTAVLATNKLRQRERLHEAGLPQPRWWVVGGGDAPPDVSGRVVVKAPDRQARKGWPRRVAGRALRCDRRCPRGARNGLALVEEHVDGPEVTVVGFSANGSSRRSSSPTALVAEPPAFGVALAHVWPSHHGGPALEVAAQAVPRSGSRTAVRTRSSGLGRNGPQVIEVAARLGGGHDAELVEAVTGIDLNGLAIDAALGTFLVPSLAQARGRRRNHPLPRGAARSARAGGGGRRRSRGVERSGSTVRLATSSRRSARGSDRAGAVLALGDSREQAVARADSAAERIRFVTRDAGALV